MEAEHIVGLLPTHAPALPSSSPPQCHPGARAHKRTRMHTHNIYTSRFSTFGAQEVIFVEDVNTKDGEDYEEWEVSERMSVWVSE